MRRAALHVVLGALVLLGGPPRAARAAGPIVLDVPGKVDGIRLEDVDGDGGEDWVPVNDPRVFAEGRNIRLGVSLNF